MRLNNKILLALSDGLGFSFGLDGICCGFTGMWNQSVLTQDESSLYKRLNLIARNKGNNFTPLLRKIREVQQKKGQHLSEADYDLLDILAFYNGIAAYLVPFKYKPYFPEGTSVIQSNVPAIFSLVKPLALQRQEINILLDKDYGFTRNDLNQYFTDLATLLEQVPFLCIINLCSEGHSVCLKYNKEKTCWIYVDTNIFGLDFRSKNYFLELNTSDLVEAIFNSFCDKLHTVFNTKVLTLDADEKNQENFKKFDQKYPLNEQVAQIHNNRNATVFYFACLAGNVEQVNTLLQPEYKVAIDKALDSGTTPFLIACQNGHFDVVLELLKPKHNINIHQNNNKKVNAFLLACAGGHLNIVRLLLKPEYQINIHQTLLSGANAFYLACQNGHLDVVLELLKPEYQIDIYQDNKGATAFLVACLQGHFDIVLELLKPKHKINIHQANEDGVTPFFAACLGGHLGIVQELLKPEYKMDIYRAADRETPFWAACQKGHFDVVLELLKPEHKINVHEATDNGATAFLVACENGHLDIVQELLKPKYKINVHQTLEGGVSPFYLACQNGHLDVVRELLKPEHNINIHQAKDNGATAFFVACQNGHLDVVRELLKPEQKVNIHQAMINGLTPFMAACEAGHLEIVQELVKPEYKTNIHQIIDNGKTAFFIACTQELSFDVVEELLKPQYKIDINQPNNKGITPLYAACVKGCTITVELLLAAPQLTSLEIVGLSGNTPLQAACRSSQATDNGLFNVLLKAGAKMDHKNEAGQTALDIAFANNKQEAISELLAWANAQQYSFSNIMSDKTLAEARIWAKVHDDPELSLYLLPPLSLPQRFFNNRETLADKIALDIEDAKRGRHICSSLFCEKNTKD